MWRKITIVLAGAVLFGLGACTAHHPRAVRGLEASTPRAAKSKGQEIVGYTTIEGEYRPFDGNVRLIGDSLEFVPVERSHGRLERPVAAEGTRVHRDQVATVDVSVRNVLGT